MNIYEGTELVKLARKAIEFGLKNERMIYDDSGEKRGIFVSIHTYPKHELRGCIGFPYPTLPLKRAVAEAAQEAAFSDPRFPPLEKKELENIIIELSILTIPQEIKCKKDEIAKKIKIGGDGLIVAWGGYSGLLLPQVATDFNFTAEEFLKQTCLKAGLTPSILHNGKCKILKFQAEIFSETKPKGKVIKKE